MRGDTFVSRQHSWLALPVTLLEGSSPRPSPTLLKIAAITIT
jgi:hypothetical protein